jgi:HK97 family phage portal protein
MIQFFKNILAFGKKSFLGGIWGNKGGGLDKTELSASNALNYYAKVSPLSDAIDRISDSGSSIQPYIQDVKTKDFINEHPASMLLKHPNPDQSYTDFFKELANYYLITGNCFIAAIGNVNRPPIELRVVPSDTVTITNDSFGFVDCYEVSSDGGSSFKYYRQEKNNRVRYLDGNLRELFIVSDFNPYSGSKKKLGLSRLNSIKSEIEQYIELSQYNHSQLRNGGSANKHWKIGGMHSPEQMANLKNQIEREYAGASNAGRNIVTDDKTEINDLTKSAKDMDYKNMKDDASNRIYNKFKVPLPLVSQETMTYSNMQTATTMFFLNSVLPITGYLFQKISHYLMPRYNQSEELEIFYDESEIPELAQKRFEQLKTQKEVGINSDNELRAVINYDAYVGGDAVYKPQGLIPVGTIDEDETLPQDISEQAFDDGGDTDLEEEQVKVDNEIEKEDIEEAKYFHQVLDRANKKMARRIKWAVYKKGRACR